MRGVAALGLLGSVLLSGCSNTHNYVGVWCGSVNWSWTYTYFGEEYTESDFRSEETCWLVARTRHELQTQERLEIMTGDVPSGWCQFYAPDPDRTLTLDSGCGFLLPAQDQAGNIFELEQSWRVADGGIDLFAETSSMDIDFTTATFFDGNELWGTATASYSGTKATVDTAPNTSSQLFEEREECVMDGCWQGAFSGNVVTGPSACDDLLNTVDFNGMRFESTHSGLSLTVDGESIPTFPRLRTCDVVAQTTSSTDGTWTYRLNPREGGQMNIEVELTTWLDASEPCELYWQADVGQCPVSP